MARTGILAKFGRAGGRLPARIIQSLLLRIIQGILRTCTSRFQPRHLTRHNPSDCNKVTDGFVRGLGNMAARITIVARGRLGVVVSSSRANKTTKFVSPFKMLERKRKVEAATTIQGLLMVKLATAKLLNKKKVSAHSFVVRTKPSIDLLSWAHRNVWGKGARHHNKRAIAAVTRVQTGCVFLRWLNQNPL